MGLFKRRGPGEDLPSFMGGGEPSSAAREARAHADGAPDRVGGIRGAIKSMRALASVEFTVSQGSPQAVQPINLSDQSEETRAAIIEVLREHGIEAHKGEAIQLSDPAVMQAVFQTLQDRGVDLGQAGGTRPRFSTSSSGGSSSSSDDSGWDTGPYGADDPIGSDP